MNLEARVESILLMVGKCRVEPTMQNYPAACASTMDCRIPLACLQPVVLKLPSDRLRLHHAKEDTQQMLPESDSKMVCTDKIT